MRFQIESEDNILRDGTLIDLCGATLLWRSAMGLLTSPVRIYHYLFIYFLFIFFKFYYYHNNYYITMGNGTFKRMFQSHLDPDEILTESKQSLIQCNTVQ